MKGEDKKSLSIAAAVYSYTANLLELGVLCLEFTTCTEMSAHLERFSNYYESGQLPRRQGHNIPVEIFADFTGSNKVKHKRRCAMFQNGNSQYNSSILSTPLTSEECSILATIKSMPCRYIIAHVRGDITTKKHELCHAKYYLDAEYKNKVDQCWQSLTVEEQTRVEDVLKKLGYAEERIVDEWQAYLCTERHPMFGKFTNSTCCDMLVQYNAA